ncbi:MAG: hypothetical protein AAF721_00955 [Myxococcota bacterium]
MLRRVDAVVWVALVFLASCGGDDRACDDGKLRRVAERLEAGTESPGAAVEAFDGIAEACPGSPATLRSLMACVTTADLSRQCDAGYVAMHATTAGLLCPEGKPPTDETARRSERAQQYFSRCVSAHDRAASRARFFLDDAPVWATFAWMAAHRAARPIARRLVDALRLSGTPVTVLDARCRADLERDACHARVSARGVTLAESEGTGLLPVGATDIFVTPEAILVDGKRIVALEQGRLPAGATDHHRIAALDSLPRTDGAPVTVYPARSLPYGVLVDVLYTLHRAGATDLGVAVEGHDTPGRLRVFAPSTWDAHGEDDDTACTLALTVGRLEVRASPCLDPEVSFLKHDLAGLGELARRSNERNTIESTAALRATAATPWSEVVAVLDAVRGPASTLSPSPSERPSASCWFCFPSLDLDPPIPWRAGNWDALRLTVDDVYVDEASGRDVAEVRARAAAATEALERCLVASDALRLRTPTTLSIVLAQQHGREVSVARAAGAGNHTPACVGEAFAPLAPIPSMVVPGDAQITYTIALPL